MELTRGRNFKNSDKKTFWKGTYLSVKLMTAILTLSSQQAKFGEVTYQELNFWMCV